MTVVYCEEIMLPGKAGGSFPVQANEEENQATFAANAPWLLEDRLRLAGALYEAAPPWTPNVVVDGNLITGQQQKSAGAAANEVLKKLGLPTSS